MNRAGMFDSDDTWVLIRLHQEEAKGNSNYYHKTLIAQSWSTINFAKEDFYYKFSEYLIFQIHFSSISLSYVKDD